MGSSSNAFRGSLIRHRRYQRYFHDICHNHLFTSTRVISDPFLIRVRSSWVRRASCGHVFTPHSLVWGCSCFCMWGHASLHSTSNAATAILDMHVRSKAYRLTMTAQFETIRFFHVVHSSKDQADITNMSKPVAIVTGAERGIDEGVAAHMYSNAMKPSPRQAR